MADPARIKSEDTPERTTATEEHPKSEETREVPVAQSPPDENKALSSQEHPKQEEKSVSVEASCLS